ncbi:hypothetical protein [Dubosiella newyorkensis]
MDIEQMRYFLAVVPEENITRACSKIHISHNLRFLQMSDLEAEKEKAL